MHFVKLTRFRKTFWACQKCPMTSWNKADLCYPVEALNSNRVCKG